MALLASIARVAASISLSLKDTADIDAIQPDDSARARPSLEAYLSTLYEDSLKAFKDDFARTKTERFKKWRSPEEFWKACELLESGDHWIVWGTRRSKTGEEWKQEVVVDETGDQIRARSSYLTSNWHDVEISPNISYIGQVLDKERELTDWGDRITLGTRYAMVYGDVVFRSILDKSEDERGLATEILCRPGSVLRTPYSTGFKRSQGCWYAVHAQMVNQAWIKHTYPDFDLSSVSPSSGNQLSEQMLGTDHLRQRQSTITQLYLLREFFIDDNDTEAIEFDQAEFDQRIAAIIEGEDVAPEVGENHPKWLKAYQDWTEERLKSYKRMEAANGPITDEVELQKLNAIFQGIQYQVERHRELKEVYKQRTGLQAGHRRKYPFGRMVCTIEEKKAFDEPNPYLLPWRELFHEYKNERVPNRNDGRGDVEIMWNRQKTLDIALSRFNDAALWNNFRKPYFHESDKALQSSIGIDLDPRKPGYYKVQPPVWRGDPGRSDEFLTLYNVTKQQSQTALGINEVTYGNAPGKQPSNELAETLLAQNETIISGEANKNLAEFVEDIIQTRIKLWRRFYTEPRIYTIDGQQVMLVLSQVLSQIPVVLPTGETVAMPVEDFQVKVRPGSNLPNRWERELSFMLQMAQTIDPLTQMPLVPMEAVLDLLGERYPSLAKNGKYRQMNQVLQLGMLALQMQQKNREGQRKNGFEGTAKRFASSLPNR